MSEKIYIDGLFVKSPNGNAPDFVIAKCSINTNKLIEFLKKHSNAKGFINFDILSGNKGYYSVLNTWQPQEKEMKENEVIDLDKEFPEEPEDDHYRVN